MDSKTIGRMIAASLAVSAICGCSDSSNNSQPPSVKEPQTKQDSIKPPAAKQKQLAETRVESPKSYKIDYTVPFGDFCMEGQDRTPEKDVIYQNVGSFRPKVLQALNGGALCTIDAGSFGIKSRNIMVRSSIPYVDGDYLKSRYFRYIGIQRYEAAMGGVRSVHSFEEVTGKELEQVQAERTRIDEARAKADEESKREAARNLMVQLRDKADADDAAAQVKLGWMLQTGWKGVSNDVTAAIALYEKAANQDYAIAPLMLGICQARGIGTGTNMVVAVKNVQRAFAIAQTERKKDDSPAFKGAKEFKEFLEQDINSRRGETYDGRAIIEKETPEVIRRNAMENYILGFCNESGFGIWNRDPSMQNAAQYYEKAAELGDTLAQFSIGVCYRKGLGGLNKNEETAQQWFLKAAKQGHFRAQTETVSACLSRKDYAGAVKWSKAAAEQGDAFGQMILGDFYAIGGPVFAGVLEKDLEAAAKYYRLSAEQDFSDAQVKLANCYEQGLGVETNRNEAMTLYLKASSGGNAKATNAIGLYLMRGWVLPKDLDKAEFYFREALKQQKLPDAQFNLAELLAEKAYSIVAGKKESDDEYEAQKLREKTRNLYKEMRELYGAAAKEGHEKAQYRNALFHMLNLEYGRDRNKPGDEMFRVAMQGKPYAWEILGASLISSKFGEYGDEDVKPAMSLKDFEHYDIVARMRDKSKDDAEYENPLSLLKTAAKDGNAIAARSLALALIYAKSVDKPKFQTMNEKDAATMTKAVKLYHEAAKQGDSIALCNLATCYLNGWGVTNQNASGAVKLYRKAIELGTSALERETAKLKAPDMSALEKMAWELHLKAIRWSIASAQTHLGICLYKGVGAEQNTEESLKMLDLAHKNGCYAAKQNLSQIKSEEKSKQWKREFDRKENEKLQRIQMRQRSSQPQVQDEKSSQNSVPVRSIEEQHQPIDTRTQQSQPDGAGETGFRGLFKRAVEMSTEPGTESSERGGTAPTSQQWPFGRRSRRK